MTIGDGTFMYNPVVPAISFADDYAMPLLILVFNNSKYASMQYFHDKFYPAGTSIATKDYYGVNIKGPSYEEAAAMVGGYAKRVEHPAELKGALQAALASIKAGKTAILNLIMPDPAICADRRRCDARAGSPTEAIPLEPRKRYAVLQTAMVPIAVVASDLVL